MTYELINYELSAMTYELWAMNNELNNPMTNEPNGYELFEEGLKKTIEWYRDRK